jgi:hypothetical protein
MTIEDEDYYIRDPKYSFNIKDMWTPCKHHDKCVGVCFECGVEAFLRTAKKAGITLQETPVQPPEMSKEDYVKLTEDLLEGVCNSYFKRWYPEIA